MRVTNHTRRSQRAMLAAGIAVLYACMPAAVPNQVGPPPPPPSPNPPPIPKEEPTTYTWPIVNGWITEWTDAGEIRFRSEPYEWSRLCRLDEDAIGTSVDGNELPLDNLEYMPIFDDSYWAAEWTLRYEVSGCNIFLVLEAPDQRIGKVREVIVTEPGIGYSDHVSVSFDSPRSNRGSSASGSVTTQSGVDSVNVNDGGCRYAPNTTVSFLGDGSGASANVILMCPVDYPEDLGTDNCGCSIGTIDVTGSGKGYTSVPEIEFSLQPMHGNNTDDEADVIAV